MQSHKAENKYLIINEKQPLPEKGLSHIVRWIYSEQNYVPVQIFLSSMSSSVAARKTVQCDLLAELAVGSGA